MIEDATVLLDMKMLETAGSIVSRLNTDVLVLKFKTDQLITKGEAILIDKNLCQIAEGGKNFVIIDALGIQSNMDSEALSYFSRDSEIAKDTVAAAILLNNLPIRLTASIFIKFHKPIFKTQIFKSRLDAEDWFEKMRKS